MNAIGIMVMFVFAAVSLFIINHGVEDKEFKRREAYWAKYRNK